MIGCQVVVFRSTDTPLIFPSPLIIGLLCFSLDITKIGTMNNIPRPTDNLCSFAMESIIFSDKSLHGHKVL